MDGPPKENWSSRIGVVLAVAGSAVGLGNFLRFPGQAAANGGGAFMIPYLVSFLLLGIPIAWCEWTMGRLGGRYGQHSGPGVMYALWRRLPGKLLGATALLIPLVVYMYYVVLEAWCLDYFLEFAGGGFAELFGRAVAAGEPGAQGEVSAVVGAAGAHFGEVGGVAENGAAYSGRRMLTLVLICFAVNFVIIYNGISKGIEVFCKWAMPALIACALVVLVRVLTLPDVEVGLGFMWNPDWAALRDPGVWLAAAGQIFFSLSVGFGLILCYSSYLRSRDDITLTSLSASSTNEFCEVVLGGMIVIPTAFLFLGAESASQGTFGLGFVTVPAVMHFMPGGSFFGAVWFGLLFLAAVTSSLSMLQPAIAFLEDGFGRGRRSSVAILGLLTLLGTLPILWFSRGMVAMDHTDFWCNFLMILVATGQVLVFGWILGAERGRQEMNTGSDIQVPRAFVFVIRYVTPTFLLVVLGMWTWQTLPEYVDGMSGDHRALSAERAVYADAIRAREAAAGSPQAEIEAALTALLGEEGAAVDAAALPAWLTEHAPAAEQAALAARDDAAVAFYVFLAVVAILVVLLVLTDIAVRGRIGRAVAEAEQRGDIRLGAP